MPLLPRLRSLWGTLAHRERLDRELDEELRAAGGTRIQAVAPIALGTRVHRRPGGAVAVG